MMLNIISNVINAVLTSTILLSKFKTCYTLKENKKLQSMKNNWTDTWTTWVSQHQKS